MTELRLPAYRNTTLKETDMFNLDELLDRVNTKAGEAEEIPEPGTEGNPWIGFNRMVSGTRQFYALSGKERRQWRRAGERAAEADQRRGQRAYNRQQRKQAFDAGTVRMQHRILTGDLVVSGAMKANLTGHVIREHRLNERKLTEPDRKAAAELRRSTRRFQRALSRVNAGAPRHADLVLLEMR